MHALFYNTLGKPNLHENGRYKFIREPYSVFDITRTTKDDDQNLLSVFITIYDNEGNVQDKKEIKNDNSKLGNLIFKRLFMDFNTGGYKHKSKRTPKSKRMPKSKKYKNTKNKRKTIRNN